MLVEVSEKTVGFEDVIKGDKGRIKVKSRGVEIANYLKIKFLMMV